MNRNILKYLEAPNLYQSIVLQWQMERKLKFRDQAESRSQAKTFLARQTGAAIAIMLQVTVWKWVGEKEAFSETTTLEFHSMSVITDDSNLIMNYVPPCA